MTVNTTHRTMVADGSFVLNLLATDQGTELLQALGISLLVTPKTRDEPFFLTRSVPGAPFRRRQPAPVAPLEEHQLLRVQDPEALDASSEVLSIRVRCAAHLSDGDGDILALAVLLGHPLATDDRRLITVAEKLFPELTTFTTLDLLRETGSANGLDDPALRRLAHDVHLRACYLPAWGEPRRDWFLGPQRDDSTNE